MSVVYQTTCRSFFAASISAGSAASAVALANETMATESQARASRKSADRRFDICVTSRPIGVAQRRPDRLGEQWSQHDADGEARPIGYLISSPILATIGFGVA